MACSILAKETPFRVWQREPLTESCHTKSALDFVNETIFNLSRYKGIDPTTFHLKTIGFHKMFDEHLGQFFSIKVLLYKTLIGNADVQKTERALIKPSIKERDQFNFNTFV